MENSSISRRIQSAIDALHRKNAEEALLNLIAALDKTAKLTYPKTKRVGDRIKAFIEANEEIIHAVSNNPLRGKIVFGDMTFPEIVYKYIRCSIAHEGELDARLVLHNNQFFKVGDDGVSLELPVSYVIGLIVVVIVAPINKRQKVNQNLLINLAGKLRRVNDLWGEPDKVLYI
ncbi:hypothetical protein [Shewanella metallivivens]|uniref:Uncharacterized protein n=1 Tax=Shewanella metallivivens TaxID=2872342 RepID=A0ABT5TJD9_9GAMM|nr:hypothetical protein [Shewanella metallivivens]MDD8058716.1 hypothetical protein [Shewanella metallivivens]